MSDTNNVSTASFLWEYSIDRAEIEEQLGRQVLGEEWYAITDKLDDAVVSVLSAL
jgi:hypothetical protein